MPRDLTTLLHDTAVSPSQRPDVDQLVQRGRRRRRTRQVVGSAAAAGVLVGVALVGANVLPLPTVPSVADQPDATSAPAVDIPEGWNTVVAGDLALSIPPDWIMAVVENAGEASNDGLCRVAIPPADGVDDADRPAGSVMVDILPPVSFPCSPSELDRLPDRPTVWFLSTSQSEQELADAQERGSPDRLGTVEGWRVEHAPLVQFVADDLSGELWLSPPDDSDLAAVLATLRPATDEDRRLSTEFILNFKVRHLEREMSTLRQEHEREVARDRERQIEQRVQREAP